MELSIKFGLSIKTIRKRFDKYESHKNIKEPHAVMIVMDTMYLKKNLGVMVFRDVLQRENVLWKYVTYETIALYQEGINELLNLGFSVMGITVDGRRGIFNAFKDIPVQMCHFHQKQIIRRYVTRNPRLEAGIELKEIVELLTITDSKSFAGLLKKWHDKWKGFLNETILNVETGKRQYTHRRLRSAYNSLKANLPYLYVYLKNLEKGMPNTTNSLDGTFSHLRDKIRAHRGLKEDRKIRLINSLLN